jgi:hypothetical protein
MIRYFDQLTHDISKLEWQVKIGWQLVPNNFVDTSQAALMRTLLSKKNKLLNCSLIG